MHALVELASDYLQRANLTALFFDAALKSFIILVMAGGLYWCSRRASAATRHLIWFLAVASLPGLPLLSWLLPSWQKPIWSLATGVDPGNQFSIALELAPTGGARVLSDGQASARLRFDQPVFASNAQSTRSRNVGIGFQARWLNLVFLAWIAGVLVASLSIALSHLRVARLLRHARPFQGADWSMLLRRSCDELRLRRRVKLLQSAENIIPMTWGSWRPIVLLPAEAEQWPTERRRVVVLHELAHVRRWDCLTQAVTRIVCALYWFNPVIWVAAGRMCAERECACDDLVLKAGCKASDYAAQLVEIARRFRHVPQVAAIAMARSSKLERRVAAIIDPSRARDLRPATAFTLFVVVAGVTFCQGGCKSHAAARGENDADLLREQQIARLRTFSAEKEKQSRALAAQDGDRFFPDFETFFTAAVKGDGKTVTNMYENFKKRHGQYEKTTGDLPHKSYWSPVLEVALAYYEIMAGEPKYEQLAIDGIINSIPAGSIFFGGTDPGRGLPTAFSKSHVDADPFFTLTQNALADGTYLEYLRRGYGSKIYTPTEEDSQRCFKEYTTDAERRLKENKLKPGEDVKVIDGKVQVSGQVAVMAINAMLAKIIFEKNPDHGFYIEESFPLEWMYPHLSPNGLIMKINREPRPSLSDDTIKQDREYWRKIVSDMIGDWLTEETSVRTVTEFVDKVYARRNLEGFGGDLRFIQSQHAQKLFSKLRSSIAGVYAWRVGNAVGDPAEQQRMRREAEFAFRQSFAICPHSPEAVFRYINLLLSAERLDDALLIADAALGVAPNNKSIQELLKELNRMKSAKKG